MFKDGAVHCHKKTYHMGWGLIGHGPCLSTNVINAEITRCPLTRMMQKKLTFELLSGRPLEMCQCTKNICGEISLYLDKN